jgi:hypothetical protein
LARYFAKKAPNIKIPMTTDSLTYQFQPKLSFQDRQFNRAKLQHYHLAIAVDNHNLRICGLELLSNKCLFIEAYTLYVSNTLQAIQAIWKNHSFLNNPSWNQVTLSIANQQYTLIPQPLFQPTATDLYLKLATNVSHDEALYYTHTNLGIIVAFAIEPQLLAWFQKTYPENQLLIIHQANTLIAGNSIYYHAKNLKRELQFFLHIETNNIHITVLSENQLFYYNKFLYQDSDEVLRYLLLVMHTLQQDPKQQEVLVSGNMVKNSLVYRQCKNYIRQVKLTTACQPFKLGWMVDKAILRHHFDLLHSYSCRIFSAP